MQKSDTRCESKQECSSSKADELKVEFSAEWLRIWRYERGIRQFTIWSNLLPHFYWFLSMKVTVNEGRKSCFIPRPDSYASWTFFHLTSNLAFPRRVVGAWLYLIIDSPKSLRYHVSLDECFHTRAKCAMIFQVTDHSNDGIFARVYAN